MVMVNTSQIKLHRAVVDAIVSWTGLVVAAALLLAAAGLFWAHNFVHDQVAEQLSAQHITFPDSGSTALTSLPAGDRQAVGHYAGQLLTTGEQAKVFADNYIAVHLQKIGGGKTYSEISAAAMADPGNKQLAAQTETMFRGEMLRGALLNAYAFGMMATVALYAAWIALGLAVLLCVLALLGLRHARLAR